MYEVTCCDNLATFCKELDGSKFRHTIRVQTKLSLSKFKIASFYLTNSYIQYVVNVLCLRVEGNVSTLAFYDIDEYHLIIMIFV